MALLGRCLDMGRFCASSEPQIPACSVLLCGLAFPFPFLTPGDEILAQQLPFCVAVLVQEPAGHVCGSACVSLTPTLTWDSAAAIFLFPYVCLEYFGLESIFSSGG